MKSGNLSIINLCVPSICFTDSPSFSGCCCKTISRREKSPANMFCETHTCDMQVEIFDHEVGTVANRHTHTHACKHTLYLAHQLHRLCTSPTVFKVEPHSIAPPVHTSGGAAAEGRGPLLLLIIILSPIINPISLCL